MCVYVLDVVGARIPQIFCLKGGKTMKFVLFSTNIWESVENFCFANIIDIT